MHVAAARRSRRRKVVVQRLVKVNKAAVWRAEGSKKAICLAGLGLVSAFLNEGVFCLLIDHDASCGRMLAAEHFFHRAILFNLFEH